MRLELGSVSVVLEKGEDAGELLRGLLRHLNNLELAQVLGVSAKTVRRWKQEGRLPSREGGQVMLMDLLHYLQPPAASPEPGAGTPQGALESGGIRAPANRRLRRPRPRDVRSILPG